MSRGGDGDRVAYRRSREGDPTWHFCASCPRWPRDDYVEQAAEPGAATFCADCWAKYLAGECTPPADD